MTLFKTICNLCTLYFSFIYKDILNLSMLDEVQDKVFFQFAFLMVYSIILGIITYITNLISNKYSLTATNNLKNDFYQKLVSKPYYIIEELNVSSVISMLTNDIGVISSNYFLPMISFIDSIILTIGSFVALSYINIYIALIVVGMTLLLGIVPLILKNYLDNMINKISKINKRFTSFIKNSLGGIDIVKLNRAEKLMLKNFANVNDEIFKINYKYNKVNFLSSGLLSLFLNLVNIFLMFLAVLLVIKEELNFGYVITIISLISFFYGPIISLTGKVTNILSSRNIRKSFLLILNDDDFESDRKEIVTEFNSINLDNVTFSYDNEVVLDKINLNFEKNDRVLILGESGSGKSTLLKLLLGFFDVYDGKISVNDIDYKEINRQCLNNMFNYCRQAPYLFDLSLRDNIILSSEFDKETFENCINECRLNKFVETLPQGYDTRINEEIRKVSEGEKQRINLARAIYNKSEIVMFDEVTSSLDKGNAYAIEEIILNLNSTIINISHKIDEKFMALYSKIVVLDKGKIVFNGNYNEFKNSQLHNKFCKIYGE